VAKRAAVVDGCLTGALSSDSIESGEGAFFGSVYFNELNLSSLA
jgi:hypothetical protein